MILLWIYHPHTCLVIRWSPILLKPLYQCTWILLILIVERKKELNMYDAHAPKVTLILLFDNESTVTMRPCTSPERSGLNPLMMHAIDARWITGGIEQGNGGMEHWDEGYMFKNVVIWRFWTRVEVPFNVTATKLIIEEGMEAQYLALMFHKPWKHGGWQCAMAYRCSGLCWWHKGQKKTMRMTRICWSTLNILTHVLLGFLNRTTSRINVALVYLWQGAHPPLNLPWAHWRRSTSLHGNKRRTTWRLMNLKNTSSFLMKILIHATHFNGGLVAMHNSQTFTTLPVIYSPRYVSNIWLVLYFISLIKFIRFSSNHWEDIFRGVGYYFSLLCQPPA